MSDPIYKPQAEWTKQSHLAQFIQKTGSQDYADLLARSQNETEWFWEEVLKDCNVAFSKPYTKLLKEGLPWPKWAEGGELSIVENCIDRHARSHPQQVALIFEADEPGQCVKWSFQDLARESSFVARELKEAGAKVGDRAALLMPMSLEMVASFFGILRAGLTVIPIFSGYGKEAIASRLQDSSVRFVFVQDKTTRRAKTIPVKESLDQILKDCPSVKNVFVQKREDFHKGHQDQPILKSVSRPAESECMLLYTSGTTGKPKACVHTPFGVLATTAKEHRYTFDVHTNDRFFWFTDIGWMMGPWELFGALQFGSAVVLFEGVPDFPDTDRLWKMVSKHQVTHLGISPTAIRVLKKGPRDFLDSQKFEALRILGSTGEPWDDESWHWFFEKVGKKRCPIMNISGGTEIMGCLLTPNPLVPLKPSSLHGPSLGVKAEAWTEEGKPIKKGIGHLVCLTPLPSMTKGFFNNKERYLETYFQKFGEKVWYHGDWALIDKDGYWFLKGRSDDTIKVAGKRVGPNEYESLVMEEARVAEVAAVGLPHPIKGEAVHLFVVLKESSQNQKAVATEILNRVSAGMGKALQAERVLFVEALPKTRSGKILRGIIQKIALQQPFDEGTAENQKSLETIRKALAT